MSYTFDDVLLDSQTRSRLIDYAERPSQAIMLIGPPGSGKATLASAAAAAALGLDSYKSLENYPYFVRLAPDPTTSGEIPIADVRKLTATLRLKIPGNATVRRAVIIEDAQRLSTEAQNALLKNIEEPPEDTIFILTAPTPKSVLPTIASRVQTLPVLPVTFNSVQQHYKDHKNGSGLESSWLLSRGNIGLLNALLNEDEMHPLRQAISEAKDLLRLSPFERLVSVGNVSRDSQKLSLLFEGLYRILTALHYSALRKDATKQAERVLQSRRQVYDGQQLLASHVQPRLVALQVLLNMSV